jgi:hypothetical protein
MNFDITPMSLIMSLLSHSSFPLLSHLLKDETDKKVIAFVKVEPGNQGYLSWFFVKQILIVMAQIELGTNVGDGKLGCDIAPDFSSKVWGILK